MACFHWWPFITPWLLLWVLGPSIQPPRDLTHLGWPEGERAGVPVPDPASVPAGAAWKPGWSPC